ncbi:MAG: 1-acyl-sn-glycerol-3-phosphate acyltransferase [Acidobacteria bacterium]|jgi:1-acyl-sn-glycerol-3-phosphate acyltransferase|nr:1-acyl-sn-glycerol-3-phosphate acyltransferase [Acidobacteriota bacterium]
MKNFPLEEAIKKNEKITFPVKESNKSCFVGKLRYWWCWISAAVLLLFIALPTMIFLWIINRRLWFYPLCLRGAKAWLKACGAKVKVTGGKNLNPNENYIFISNHRSYLDTATLFAHAGRRIGLVAKKELLKVPVFGQGMGFVNIIAIDRSNPERALQSMNRAETVLKGSYSFGVFAEGTRALPGELLPFKKGAFHLALQTAAPIIPVAIKNTDWMMGKKTGAAYAGTIEMVLLPPIETKNLTENDLPDLLKKVRGAIAEELSMEN